MKFKCGKCSNAFEVVGIKESVVTCSKCGSRNSIRESEDIDTSVGPKTNAVGILMPLFGRGDNAVERAVRDILDVEVTTDPTETVNNIVKAAGESRYTDFYAVNENVSLFIVLKIIKEIDPSLKAIAITKPTEVDHSSTIDTYVSYVYTRVDNGPPVKYIASSREPDLPSTFDKYALILISY